jgi:hypothetical protein
MINAVRVPAEVHGHDVHLGSRTSYSRQSLTAAFIPRHVDVEVQSNGEVQIEYVYQIRERRASKPYEFGSVQLDVGAYTAKVLSARVRAESDPVAALKKVVRAIQEFRGTRPTSMRPLNRSIDLIIELTRSGVIPAVQHALGTGQNRLLAQEA